MYLVRYGEIALKGNNRYAFERQLIQNINEKLLHIGITVKGKRSLGKICIPSTDAAIQDILKTTPGIVWFAKSKETELDRVARETCCASFFPILGSSFCVRTTRSNKRFPLSSMDIDKKLGAYVVAKTAKKVDLTRPETTIFVNIGEKHAYFFCAKEKGVGGLPVGSVGKVVSLLSGGIDSPVASFLAMKRGCRVIAVHAYNRTDNAEKVAEKVTALAKRLAVYQGKLKLYLIPYEPIQQEIVRHVPAPYRMIAFKRSILRVGNLIAERV